MAPADILASLFPGGHDVAAGEALLAGTGRLADGTQVRVVGAARGKPLGIDEAIWLAARILAFADARDGAPILFLVDTASQRMSRRDELLGLNEYLAHLAKTLLLAEKDGHRTIGLLCGGSAAGAFIATALACGTLVALPDACPEVMDLPSMARITKLPIELLREKAEATPVFAPGLDNFVRTGAITASWDPSRPLADQLALLLADAPAGDDRATRAEARRGRPRAASIAARVVALATAG